MNLSYDFQAPDHFTAGAVGEPGQRVFYLQAREDDVLVTLRCEKEQVRALGEYLARLLAETSREAGGGATDDEPALLEPIEPAWAVSALGVGYDEEAQRIVIEATALVEEEGEGDPASARFRITRAQAAAFAARARALMKAGRPVCPLCSQPVDPSGHVCVRMNGHVVR